MRPLNRFGKDRMGFAALAAIATGIVAGGVPEADPHGQGAAGRPRDGSKLPRSSRWRGYKGSPQAKRATKRGGNPAAHG